MAPGPSSFEMTSCSLPSVIKSEMNLEVGDTLAVMIAEGSGLKNYKLLLDRF
jgi:hypothetical protein